MANYVTFYLDFSSDDDADIIRDLIYEGGNTVDFTQLVDMPKCLENLNVTRADMHCSLFGLLTSSDPSLANLQKIISQRYFDSDKTPSESTIIETFGEISKKDWQVLSPKKQNESLIRAADMAYAVITCGEATQDDFNAKTLQSVYFADALDMDHTSWLMQTKWTMPIGVLKHLAKKFPKIPFRSYGYEPGMGEAYDFDYDGNGTIRLVECTAANNEKDYVDIAAKIVCGDETKYVDGYFVEPWDYDDYEDVVAKYPNWDDIPETDFGDFEEDPCFNSPNAVTIRI